jgi:hypothetical protein
VIHASSLRALAAIAGVAALAACGSSSTSTPPTAGASAPLATATAPTQTAASSQCPTGATVGSALGITLPNPVGGPGGGSTHLPAGATGEVCEYHAATYNVIIEVLTGVNPSLISSFSDKFPVPYKPVSGVGDQARSFEAPLNGGKDNEGVVATKGSNLVSIGATDTPASLAQVEALVSSLL